LLMVLTALYQPVLAVANTTPVVGSNLAATLVALLTTTVTTWTLMVLLAVPAAPAPFELTMAPKSNKARSNKPVLTLLLLLAVPTLLRANDVLLVKAVGKAVI